MQPWVPTQHAPPFTCSRGPLHRTSHSINCGLTPRYQQNSPWQAYFQVIPTKEDFKLLIEEVKSACRAEI